MAYDYLEVADFLLIAEAAPRVPAQTLALSNRIVALADSALAAPAASFAGEEFYPELAEKAAVLCSGAFVCRANQSPHCGFVGCVVLCASSRAVGSQIHAGCV